MDTPNSPFSTSTAASAVQTQATVNYTPPDTTRVDGNAPQAGRFAGIASRRRLLPGTSSVGDRPRSTDDSSSAARARRREEADLAVQAARRNAPRRAAAVAGAKPPPPTLADIVRANDFAAGPLSLSGHSAASDIKLSNHDNGSDGSRSLVTPSTSSSSGMDAIALPPPMLSAIEAARRLQSDCIVRS